jgi:serine protease Do
MFNRCFPSLSIALTLALSPTFIVAKEPPKTPATTQVSPELAALQQLSKGFTNVAKQATPAVVFIRCEVSHPEPEESNGPYGYSSPFDNFGDDFLNRFFNMPPRSNPQRQAPQISQGSGFLISSDGYIVTNCHVIKGADKITVVFDDNKELDATLIGTDPQTDLAVLKVEGKDLPYLNFANSDNIDVGEWAIAIGSPFQLEATVTVGVVSAKGRQNLKITDLEDFLQTDAAINPGNSGGPLLNIYSQVIGVNTAIVSRSGGYMGIGFAIPSNMAKVIANQIIDKGSVTRGFIGVSLQPVDKDIADAFNLSRPEGALVSEVVKDSPADKGGVKQGDIILKCNDNPVKSVGGFRNEVSLMNPGSTVKLQINRKGETMVLTIVLGNANDKVATNSTAQQRLGIEVDALSAQLAKQLGLSSTDLGVVITKVRPGSPAAMAGLRPGYLIQAVNHKRIEDLNEFNEQIADLGSKTRVLLLIKQNNITRFYSIKMD